AREVLAQRIELHPLNRRDVDERANLRRQKVGPTLRFNQLLAIGVERLPEWRALRRKGAPLQSRYRLRQRVSSSSVVWPAACRRGFGRLRLGAHAGFTPENASGDKAS